MQRRFLWATGIVSMLILLQPSAATAQSTSAKRPGVRVGLIVFGAALFGLGYAPCLAAAACPIPLVGPIIAMKDVDTSPVDKEGFPPVIVYGALGGLAFTQLTGAALIAAGIALGGAPPSDRPQARLVLTPILAPGRIGLSGTF